MYTGPGVPDCLHETTNTHSLNLEPLFIVHFRMASVHGAPPTVAVVIVVDSSITLASEWPRIVHDYFPQLFRRLAGENPSSLAVRLRLSRFCIHSQTFRPLSTFA